MAGVHQRKCHVLGNEVIHVAADAQCHESADLAQCSQEQTTHGIIEPVRISPLVDTVRQLKQHTGDKKWDSISDEIHWLYTHRVSGGWSRPVS